MAIAMGARLNKLCVLRFGNFTSFCDYFSYVREKEGILSMYCKIIWSSERNLRRVVVFYLNWIYGVTTTRNISYYLY
jgi:hypothetical protein